VTERGPHALVERVYRALAGGHRPSSPPCCTRSSTGTSAPACPRPSAATTRAPRRASSRAGGPWGGLPVRASPSGGCRAGPTSCSCWATTEARARRRARAGRAVAHLWTSDGDRLCSLRQYTRYGAVVRRAPGATDTTDTTDMTDTTDTTDTPPTRAAPTADRRGPCPAGQPGDHRRAGSAAAGRPEVAMGSTWRWCARSPTGSRWSPRRPGCAALLIGADGPAFTVGGDLRHLTGQLDRLPDELHEMISLYHRTLAGWPRLPFRCWWRARRGGRWRAGPALVRRPGDRRR